MSDIFNKIKTSFKASLKGEETIQNLIYRWGLLSWLVAYFVINKLIKMVDLRFVDILLSILAISYFIGHIYALRKCSPKKPNLSKEEKKKMKEEARKDLGKKVMRKLLLQESIKKWDPVFVTMVIDVFCITQFLEYIIK